MWGLGETEVPAHEGAVVWAWAAVETGADELGGVAVELYVVAEADVHGWWVMEGFSGNGVSRFTEVGFS